MVSIRRALHPMLVALVLLFTGRIRPRALSLFVAAVTASCGAGDADPGPRTIERLRERSTTVVCEPVEGFPENGAVVEDLHAVSDSTFLVLLPLERAVRLYDHRLEPVFSLAFDEDGPLGVRTPRSADLVDDTLVYVADLGARSVRVLSRSRRDRGTLRIDFPPDGIRATPSGLVVTAFPMAMGPGQPLVHALDGTDVHPLGLTMEPHEDPRIAALGNMLELTVLPSGALVVAHQVLSSRAAVFHARPGGGFDVVVTTVPVTPSERSRLGKVPADLFERENVGDLAAPVISASADRGSGDYLYLTRTGSSLGSGGTEKAIVRARDDLSYVASYLLDVDAQDFVYLSRTRTALVIDHEATWHRCSIP